MPYRNKAKNKLWRIKHLYGLQEADYLKMITTNCPICGISYSNSNHMTKIAVDHNHETGKVRGLICMSCNLGLGRFDSITKLKKALEYMIYAEQS
jgi:hypothetical protein